MYTKHSKIVLWFTESPITASYKTVNIVSLTHLSTVLVDNYPQALINIGLKMVSIIFYKNKLQ